MKTLFRYFKKARQYRLRMKCAKLVAKYGAKDNSNPMVNEVVALYNYLKGKYD